MNKLSGVRQIAPALLIAGLVFAAPVGAQMGGMMNGSQGDRGMMKMSGVMHDMADHMVSLSGRMSQGNMTAAQQKQMAESMREMAGMIDNMSSMTGKGMMMGPEQMGNLDAMQKQMDRMMK